MNNGLRSEVVLVTPELARTWLERNHPHNRRIMRNRVEPLVHDILANAWKVTHQGIAFDAAGFLIDGQHRLTAIVEAGAPVSVFVVWNDAAKFDDPIDRGSPRELSMLSDVPARTIAAYRTLAMLEGGANRNIVITLSQIAEYKQREAERADRITSIQLGHSLIGPVVAACVYAMPCDEAAVVKFAKQVADGEMLRRGDPAYAFRSWKERNARKSPWHIALATLNCIRFAANARPLTSVYLGESGYRAVTTRRRTMNVPNTPSRNVVDSMNWPPSHAELEEDAST